jgi:two-component system, OmpR family, alkaline phosphatase synthesis response regulator PhoP
LSTHKIKILVVDDEKNLLDIIVGFLRSKDFHVVTADNGHEALNVARQEKPDLIILDLMLPLMNGYEVCRLLKFDEKFKRTPVIILTSKINEIDQTIWKEVRANCYMNKPFDAVTLLSKIDELIAAHKKEMEELE